MKIGIIGLRARQITDLSHRKFNGHEIVFYKEKSFPQQTVASFVRHVDKVLVIQTGIPKTALDYIPYDKRHVMAGSVSTVIRYLDSMEPAELPPPPPAKIEHVVKTAPAKHVPAEPAPPVITTVRPPNTLGTSIPPGYASQYTWTPDVAMINADELPMRRRFEMLNAAHPGDVVRYARPAGVEVETWKNRVGMLRHNRLQKNKQLIEAHFYPEYVDLLVMRADAPEPEVARGVIESTPVVVADLLKTTSAPLPSVEPAQVEPARMEGLSSEPLLGHTAPVMHTDVESSFWRGVYIAAMHNGSSYADAGVTADLALVEYHKRFK